VSAVDRIDHAQLEAARSRLGDVVVDPGMWPEVLEQISAAAGAIGAVLLKAGAGTYAVRTASIAHAVDHYFENGFNTRDVRVERGVPLLMRGKPVITDQDILTHEQMRRDAVYTECLIPYQLAWFAAIGIRLYGSLWSLMVQRTLKEGPFSCAQKQMLAKLGRPLTEVAMLSSAVGRTALTSATNALREVDLPAVAIDRRGNVLDVNSGVEHVFDESFGIKIGRLSTSDGKAQQLLDKLFERLSSTGDKENFPAEPILVRRQKRTPVIIRVLPVPCAARTPFLGARAILTFTMCDQRPTVTANTLAEVFGLTPAEGRLASIIAEGASPEQAAERLGVARETARNQLKAVFAKTRTHRQSELVALLAKL
jgi:DNA-binding CsgD family transcriptional regulator